MTIESSQVGGRGAAHRVVVIVDENSNPFELGCATKIFGLHRPELGFDLYDFRLCSPTPRMLMRDGFFILTAVAGLDAVDSADTVLVPNRPDVEVPRRAAVLDAISRAHTRGRPARRILQRSVHHGRSRRPRRATSHRALAVGRRVPPALSGVELQNDVLFVDDGDVLTAAGSAAALDLGLHIVRRDHGAEIADRVSRRLVFAAHRDGGQRQFVERPMPTRPDRSLGPLLSWAQQQLERPMSIADLATQGGFSPATLHRRFRAELGTTPLTWLTAERVTLACRLIEHGDLSLDAVARHSGLGTPANLRALIRRRTVLTPSAYQQRFGTAQAGHSIPGNRPSPVDRPPSERAQKRRNTLPACR